MCTSQVQGPDDFAALMEREYVPLVRVAVVIVGDEGVAEEVVQEAFARAFARWRRISRYERPGAWVRLVTVRLAVRAAAQRKRNSSGPLPELGIEDRRPDAALAMAIAGLGEEERAAVVLHYLCDLQVKEVAQILQTKPGTIRVRLHRARTNLAAAMTEEVSDGRTR